MYFDSMPVAQANLPEQERSHLIRSLGASFFHASLDPPLGPLWERAV